MPPPEADSTTRHRVLWAHSQLWHRCVRACASKITAPPHIQRRQCCTSASAAAADDARFRGKFDWLLTTDDMAYVVNDNLLRMLAQLDHHKVIPTNACVSFVCLHVDGSAVSQ